jgi:hypothetical protein
MPAGLSSLARVWERHPFPLEVALSLGYSSEAKGILAFLLYLLVPPTPFTGQASRLAPCARHSPWRGSGKYLQGRLVELPVALRVICEDDIFPVRCAMIPGGADSLHVVSRGSFPTPCGRVGDIPSFRCHCTSNSGISSIKICDALTSRTHRCHEPILVSGSQHKPWLQDIQAAPPHGRVGAYEFFTA